MAKAKTAEVVETVKEAVVVEEKVAKKAPAKKTTKTTAKKVKEEAKTEILIQYQALEISAAAVEEKVKAQFVAEGHRAGCIKTLNIYVKPEEYKAYYVINEKYDGCVQL